MKRLLISISVLLALALVAIPVTAQDDGTPVKGDADSASLAIVQSFLETDFGEGYLAEDIVYEDPFFPDALEGTDDLTDSQSLFYGESFSDIRIDPLQYIVAGDTVAAEFFFTADHTGPYYGRAASGARVAFQVAGVFKVEDEAITAIRMYYDLATLNTQVGYAPGLGAPAPAVAAGGVEIVDVDDIEEDFDDYVGDVVRVSGEIDEVLSDWALVLEDEDIIDLTGQEYLLVLAGPSGVFEFGVDEGDSVDIIGTVREFSFDELQAELDYELDADVLAEHSDLPVLVNDVAIE